jgi:anti-sigma-K factor RskA
MTMSNQSEPPVHDESMEELAAGYVLGSLSKSDRQVFDAHREHCERCWALVRDLGAVVAVLPDAVEEMDVSADVKSRLFAEIEHERSSGGHVDPVAIQARRSSRRNLWSLATAAMLLISTGLGLWNIQLQQDLQTARSRDQLQQEVVAALAAGGQSYQLSGTDRAPSARAVVIADPGGQNPILVMGSLPSLPSGQVYQAWVIGASGPVDAGVFSPSAASGSAIRLTQRPQPTETVALTIEPNGGRPTPTGPVVVAGAV